jgi:hypothetical protein
MIGGKQSFPPITPFLGRFLTRYMMGFEVSLRRANSEEKRLTSMNF